MLPHKTMSELVPGSLRSFESSVSAVTGAAATYGDAAVGDRGHHWWVEFWGDPNYDEHAILTFSFQSVPADRRVGWLDARAGDVLVFEVTGRDGSGLVLVEWADSGDPAQVASLVEVSRRMVDVFLGMLVAEFPPGD